MPFFFSLFLFFLLAPLSSGRCAPAGAAPAPSPEPYSQGASSEADSLPADSAGWAPAKDDAEFAAPGSGFDADSATYLQASPLLAGAASPDRRVDYLWVVRTALLSAAAIDSVVARARAMEVRGLLVQVVGRGDAYYRSDLLPRPEALGPGTFDPLGELIARAKPAGLEVHAWMNCMLVWSAPKRPKDPRHVVNAHPEWVAHLKDGRPMTRLSDRERRRLGVEGVYLNPAHPRVRLWLSQVASEIVTRYPVDGLHLDYIRQPDAAIGYDPTTRARFALETSIDPARIRRLEPRERARADSAWAEFQRAQVTEVVRQVGDSVRAARPGILLSAAVVADTARAERGTAQPWRRWVRERLIDRAFLMCYAPSVQVVMGQLLALTEEFGTTDRVVPGIAVYNTSAGTAAIKIKGARALGYPLVALYSYDSLFARVFGWSHLRERLSP